MIEILLISLGLTLLFELAYAWLWGLKPRDLCLVLWMNVLTNPLVVLWHYGTVNSGLLISTVLPELTAIIVECFLLVKFGYRIRNPVALGICINVFSYFIGLLFNFFIF